MTNHAISESALSVFSFNSSFTVRVAVINSTVWFVASDIAKALEYRDAGNMVRILDDDEKGTHNMSTPGGNQAVTVISESGLYHAVLKSRKPEAKAFRKWVTSEVLPSIRKTGEYSDQKTITPEQQNAIRMLISDRVRSMPANKPQETYAYFYRSLKIHFGVSKYNQLPYNKFYEAVCFIRSLSTAESDHGITLTTADALILHTLLCILPRLIDSSDKYNDAQILLPSLMELKERCSSAFNNLLKGAL